MVDDITTTIIILIRTRTDSNLLVWYVYNFLSHDLTD